MSDEKSNPVAQWLEGPVIEVVVDTPEQLVESSSFGAVQTQSIGGIDGLNERVRPVEFVEASGRDRDAAYPATFGRCALNEPRGTHLNKNLAHALRRDEDRPGEACLALVGLATQRDEHSELVSGQTLRSERFMKAAAHEVGRLDQGPRRKFGRAEFCISVAARQARLSFVRVLLALIRCAIHEFTIR